MILAADGNIVSTFVSGNKYRAQKIKPDSSFLWPYYSVAINGNNNDLPFYDDYTLVSAANGNIAAFWGTYNGDIASSRIVSFLGNVSVEETSASNFGIFPNPSTGNFTIRAKINSSIEIYSATGQLLMKSVTVSAQQVFNPSLKPGIYLVKILSGNESTVQKLVIE